MTTDIVPAETTLRELYEQGQLSTRAWCVCTNDGLLTAGDVANRSDAEMLRIINLGKRTLFELRLICGPRVELSLREARRLRSAWVRAAYDGKTNLGFDEWKASITANAQPAIAPAPSRARS